MGDKYTDSFTPKTSHGR